MSTLTITIENIPDGALSVLWKDTIKDAKKSLGVPVEATDHIQIDFAPLSEAYEDESRLAELLTEALFCHTIMTGHKILNS